MDETSVTVNELGEQWNAILQSKEGNIDNEELQNALTSILPLCRQSGLPLVCIDSLIEVLYKLAQEEDNSEVTSYVLYCMIPNEPLTEDQTDRLLHWFRTTYSTKEEVPGKFTYWLIAALKVGLIDKEFVRRNCYFSFFTMFVGNVQSDGLCFIIKELMLAQHVTSLSISRLLKCFGDEENNKVKKQVAVVIKQFIQLSPSTCRDFKLPKTVPAKLTRPKDKELSHTLDRLIKIHSTEGSNLTLTKIYEDFSEDIKCTSNSIGITPVYNSNSGRIKVTSLRKLSDLIKHYDNLDAPGNLLSVLDGKCGASYVALSSPGWQKNFEEQISVVLSCLLYNKPRPNLDYSSLFKALNEVQVTSCQGIPSVTSFIKKYFILWDGLKFRNEIFDLITWAHFSSYEDLKEFMFNLFEVFIMADLEFQIKLLDAFGSLYKNMMSIVAVRIMENMHIPFITQPPTWFLENALNVFETLILFFEKFIDCGMIVHKSGWGILLQTLLLFHQIFLVEEKFDVNMLTVLPPSVFLKCQTSSSVAVLNSLSLLIIRYWKNQSDIELSVNETTIVHRQKVGLIRKYALDTVKVVKDGMGNNTLDGTLMGQLIGESECQEFKKAYGDTKDILSIMKNSSTAPVILEIAKKMKLDMNSISPEHYPDLLDMFAPHCAQLIRMVESGEFEETSISCQSGDPCLNTSAESMEV